MLYQPTSMHRPGIMPAGTLHTLNELLASARASVDSDPDRAIICLDRIARMIEAPSFDSIVERLLLPQAQPLKLAGASIKGGLAPWQLNRALSHIQEYLSQSLPVETLAHLTRLSSGHFCRAFKVSVGETPHNYLIRQRIRHAQKLMLTTEDTLSQIAYACGLTDQAHLTRLFRKLVGDTPLSWRRSCRRG